MNLKKTEDLGQYIIKKFELKEDEYTYKNKKLGYEFDIHPRNNLKKLRHSILEQTIKEYCEEKNMYLIKLEPITYIDLKRTETVQIREKEDKTIYRIKVTQIRNRNN